MPICRVEGDALARILAIVKLNIGRIEDMGMIIGQITSIFQDGENIGILCKILIIYSTIVSIGMKIMNIKRNKDYSYFICFKFLVKAFITFNIN